MLGLDNSFVILWVDNLLMCFHSRCMLGKYPTTSGIFIQRNGWVGQAQSLCWWLDWWQSVRSTYYDDSCGWWFDVTRRMQSDPSWQTTIFKHCAICWCLIYPSWETTPHLRPFFSVFWAVSLADFAFQRTKYLRVPNMLDIATKVTSGSSSLYPPSIELISSSLESLL